MTEPKPLSRLPTFEQFKARRNDVRVGYNSVSERLPYHPWYSLQHENLRVEIRQLLLPLLRLASTRSSEDNEIEKLQRNLEDADNVFRKDSLCIAIIGEQGTGKSQTICSILDREVVHVSSSSAACTAFPTIIVYKEGAKDDTKRSDVYIQYLNSTEIEDCIREQARRYRDGHPLELKNQYANHNRLRAVWTPDSDDSDSDESNNYNEEEELTEVEKEEVMSCARTAKEFFEILFHADQMEDRNAELEAALESANLQSDTFTQKCLGYARERLNCIGAATGRSKHKEVHHDDVGLVRSGARKLWPLVKSLRLETGHVGLAQDKLRTDLKSKLRVTYVHYTTETHVYCPVALAMRTNL